MLYLRTVEAKEAGFQVHYTFGVMVHQHAKAMQEFSIILIT